MTTPTPESAGSGAPGYYHAEGDPPDLVRYWDGTRWVGDPMPRPPSAPGDVGAPLDDGGATLGPRIGAVLIDGVIGVIIAIVLALPFVDDTSDTTGDDFSFEVTGPGVFLGWVVMFLLLVVLVATKGGSPGKLILGMRIQNVDGSPVSFGTSALRAAPWLVTVIPLVGILAWIGIAVAGSIMINTDPQNRSIFDRVAGTRVVKA